ncbi:MAG: protein kinase [Verrucomicrobia bacterium]|nr:protein kinase [Verrucomicrobiota bacterium]
MDQDHSSAAPEVCPACGTPYPAGAEGEGCPVCLLQGALGSAAAGDRSPLGKGPSQPDEDGRFDHYEVVRREDGAFEELGRGAMGVTYRALDTVLGRPVALKVLSAHIAAHPHARERFLREARAAARLRHPNVISVFYYGVRKGDDQCFYTMELVEGESVEARLRRLGPLSVALALEVVTQVARALAAAEAEGLVHRDLKPANLMLARGPEAMVKVIDFGLAKAAEEVAGAANLTQGGFVGTPTFASPEQCGGVGVDVRSDVYSLGVTLWVMLTGKTPFRGSPAQVRQQHRETPLPLEHLEGVPQPVTMLLEALLAKEPARRFQIPAQLLDALPKVTAAIQAGRTLSRRGLLPGASIAAGAGIRRPPILRGPIKISLARLPVTTSQVFGREEDLAFLDATWADPQVNVVSVVAWGGVGKSTLINHWLRGLAAERYRPAEVVYGWSFYRQGISGDVSSADEFLDAALAWFGDVDPRLGTAWEKGERLARLIARRRTLLILDGLEPLQHPPGPREGRLREPALQALLRELAAFNRGLCVITTRLPVADLADHLGTSVRQLELEQLSGPAGAQLLRALGVKGADAELRMASQEFQGHCLALTLLGSYLADAYEGDIRCRADVSTHLAHDVRQGAHARKVMASYQSWFGEGPELSVLRMLGLFDRPASEKALGTLLEPPAIPGLTESLTGLSPSEWRMILAGLRRARLLADGEPHNPGDLDIHPLVREYFGDQLRTQRNEAWQEANRRLYRHYRALAPPFPESVREMEPLFLAVTCGCYAGLLRESLHEIYIPRIQRGDASFAANVLGARTALLSVLVHFFEDGCWGAPVQKGFEGQRLSADDQLFILMQAGMYLTAIRGSAAAEVRTCYERAESLCRSLNRPLMLYLALVGQWRHSLNTDRLTIPMQIARRVHALAEEQDDPALMVVGQHVLGVTFYFMGDFEAAQRHLMRGLELWRSGGVRSPVEEVDAPIVACLCYWARCKWHFGEIASCLATTEEAISLAKELHDAHGLAVALSWAATLAYYERKPAEAERSAADLIELSTHHHFAQWLSHGAILRGWAHSVSGRTAEGLARIEQGIKDYQSVGAVLGVPSFLGLKAEALHLADRSSEALEAIKKAEALVERFEQRYFHAELHRLRGMCLAALGGEDAQTEAAFRDAIQTARQQKSISLLKRAETTYAECRSQDAGASAGRGLRLPLG